MFKKITFQLQIKFVRLIDNIITFTQLFRLRNYVFQLRIKKITGKINKNSETKNLLIFIFFEKSQLPNLTLETLEIFKRAGFNLLIINNGNPKFEQQLLDKGADVIITRNNTGKDFGGYKDATLFLNKNDLTHWKKVIYANDSVIYPRKIIHQLIHELTDDQYDFIAHSQVKEIHFHFQSFLFSCSNNLLKNDYFNKFWKSYIPLDRRRYMINQGEVGLTKKILKTGCRIKVINTYQNFKEEIDDFASANEMLLELPDRYRSQKSISEIQLKLSESLMNNATNRVVRISNSETKNLIIRNAIIRDQATQAFYQNIVEDLYREISIGNPSHLGLHYFLKRGSPFVIKRDLSYRAGYDFDYLSMILKKYYPDEYRNIIAMIKFPSGNHYKGLKLLMFNNGII